MERVEFIAPAKKRIVYDNRVNWDALQLGEYLREKGWDRRDAKRIDKLLQHFGLSEEKRDAAAIAVDRELKNIRSVKKNDGFECKCCDKVFRSLLARNAHVECKRAQEDAQYICEIASEMKKTEDEERLGLFDEKIKSKRKVLEGLGNVTCVECQCKMFLEERPDGSMLYRCKTCRRTIAYRDLAQLLHGKRDNDLENALGEEIVKELIETYSQIIDGSDFNKVVLFSKLPPLKQTQIFQAQGLIVSKFYCDGSECEGHCCDVISDKKVKQGVRWQCSKCKKKFWILARGPFGGSLKKVPLVDVAIVYHYTLQDRPVQNKEIKRCPLKFHTGKRQITEMRNRILDVFVEKIRRDNPQISGDIAADESANLAQNVSHMNKSFRVYKIGQYFVVTVCAKKAQIFAVRWFVTQGRSTEALAPLILAAMNFEDIESVEDSEGMTLYLDANVTTAVKLGLSKVEELNIDVNTSCHTKRAKMSKEKHCFINGESEIMVKHGVYKSDPQNHIQKAEYWNRRAEEICRNLKDMGAIMRALRKLEFSINNDCYKPSDYHHHVKEFYLDSFDGKSYVPILSPAIPFPCRPSHKSVWKGMSEDDLILGIAKEFNMEKREARQKVLLARKTAAPLRGRSRSDDYVVFAYYWGGEIRGEVKGKKTEKGMIIHDVFIDPDFPFKNRCNCKQGRAGHYCTGYGATLARFIDDENTDDITGGLGNLGNNVERVLKIWKSRDNVERLLVKLKNGGWGQDLQVMSLTEYLKDNNYWPIQWYYAYVDACILIGGKQSVLY